MGSKADLDRTETMLGVMQQLREREEINTQVVLIVWNMIKSLKNDPCDHNGVTLPFTPTKVSLDILDSCNTRLRSIAKDLPGVFVHGYAHSFANISTAVLP